jgi:predicted dehydrogenase
MAIQAQPLRWGILGASRFAGLISIPGMKKSPACQIVALASRSLEKAQAAADELGIGRAHGSYEALLADPEVEAIYIPLPNHLHVQWSERAACAGKHVLCEKPMALSAAEAEPLVKVARETGKFIVEAFMIRHHPQWQLARDRVRSGAIGDLRAIQCAFSYHNVDLANIRNQRDIGGGALYDIGCYAINLSRYIFGSEPNRAVAVCERDPTSGVDRLTSGILDFGTGQVTFTVATQLVPFQRVQIFGTQARIEIEIPFNAPDRVSRVLVDDGRDKFGGGVVVTECRAVDQYAEQVTNFAAAVRSGSTPENHIEDSLGTMRVIDALFRSANSGRFENVVR